VEGNSGSKNADFTVTLSAPSVQDVLVVYATLNSTATFNQDYQRVFGNTLVIPAGSTSVTATVRIVGDFLIEPDEQFFVLLQSPQNATIADGQATGTIINDDSNGKLQFSSATYSATEDAGAVTITVARVDGATGVVTVDYATSDGTASAGSDYTATSGTLTFNQGETSKTLTIPIGNDGVFEADETVNVTLSNPTGSVR
jgi:Calx-beta domain-containing protein